MQRFNQFTGTVIVPLFARLVLAAAFLTMGWNKVMNTQVFSGEDARILIELDVVEGGKANPPVVRPASQESRPRSLRDDIAGRNRAADQADDDAVDLPAPAQADEENDGAAPEVAPEELIPPDVEGLTVEAKKLHTVTVMLYKKDWRTIDPAKMAWVSALTELFGGALLLVGLFARVWGLGLAIAMGVAFYLTSLPIVLDHGLFGLTTMDDGYEAFNRLYNQLALLVLALGVFLTGAGAVSLDRLLFRPGSTAHVTEEYEV